MKLSNVAILGVDHVDGPHRVPSAVLASQMADTLRRLGFKLNFLNTLAGVAARRFFDPGTPPSRVAAAAGERLLTRLGTARDRVGVLVNTSVCRDFLEPSTAAMVHGELGLGGHCASFDLGNACLGFLNGMDLAGTLIERGEVELALVVAGEVSRDVTEATVLRLAAPDADSAMLRSQLASLTLGSGGVAMLLGPADRHPGAHRYLGGVALSATEHRHLCRGRADRMDTDAVGLLSAGVDLARATWVRARQELGWGVGSLEWVLMHQVSRPHTEQLAAALGLSLDRCPTIFQEFGNIGPASLPILLSKHEQSGRLRRGHRVGLLGIGSGLSCQMAEVVW